MDTVEAATNAIATHDFLQDVTSREPSHENDPAGWLSWHDEEYRPAYERWSGAMDRLCEALHDPHISRHPYNFRPLCEKIIAGN